MDRKAEQWVWGTLTPAPVLTYHMVEDCGLVGTVPINWLDPFSLPESIRSRYSWLAQSEE